MKNRLLYLVISLCISFYTQAQIVQDDFEGNGNITTWFGDDCGMNTSFANPYQQGDNTSATVLEYTDTGGQYANVRFDATSNFDFTNNALFSLKLYVPSSGITGGQNNQVSLKLQDGNLGAPWVTQSEIIKPINLDEWQTVTFNFASDPYINLDSGSLPPIERTDFNRIVIQINGENNNDHVLAYLDDFHFDASTVITDPGDPDDPVYDNLVWSDEFDGNGAIDSSKWFHQTQLPLPDSWFNGEIQHYTNRTDNAFVSNGTLKVMAKRENFTDQGVTKQFTSARLNSKFAFQNGRVEVRAKLPFGVGTWPAIWMLGKNINEDGAYWDNQGFGTTAWPACGEIDIMEHWGHNQNYVQSAMHTPSSHGATVNHGGQNISTASTAFHVYELVWTPQKMVFSVDGNIHYTYEPETQDASTWPFNAEQYLLLNVAIQGSIAPSFTQSAMEIDYVRVYQESTLSNNTTELQQWIIYYPNPVSDVLTFNVNEELQGEIVIKIYSITGKLIRSDKIKTDNNATVVTNLSLLKKGVYFAVFKTKNKAYRLRFLKS